MYACGGRVTHIASKKRDYTWAAPKVIDDLFHDCLCPTMKDWTIATQIQRTGNGKVLNPEGLGSSPWTRHANKYGHVYRDASLSVSIKSTL